VCNADAVVLDNAFELIRHKVFQVVISLGDCAVQNKIMPALGFTHYQPAQPTTVGRRSAQWAHDLHLCLTYLFFEMDSASLLRRGLKGATGTQASFLRLFDGDSEKVDKLEHCFVDLMAGLSISQAISDWTLGDHGRAQQFATYRLTGQTYPRIADCYVLAGLGCPAAVLHKIATDIRLLSNRKEIDEPFGDKQIGSSAMPYKRNPMKCERICGLTRFVMNLVGNAYDTAATQWLERTLDDSSNRRLSLPEAFLALDGALDLMHQVASGLVVHEAMVRKNLMAELPFLATENILMEAVKAGGDRQELHERIRVHAQAAGMRVKQEGLDNDLIERLRSDPAFKKVHHLLTEDALLDPMKYVGRAVEQTERFIKEVVQPLREQYGDELDKLGSSDRGV
jgi:adenylosuccinate lyase